jgi:hypothetical protein
MFIRFFAVCLATLVAAMPLAARAADFRLNAIGSKGVPDVYAWSGCRNLGVDGNRRLSYAGCAGDGGIQIRKRYSEPQSDTCELRVWETGLLKFTWHAEFKKNEHTVCSIKWANADTLDLQIIN